MNGVRDGRWKRGWVGLAGLMTAYFAAFAFYPRLFFLLGVNHYNVWFLDTFALLASNDAVSRGLNPYAINPLDYLGRPHVYSHWWLHLRDFGLTRADAGWLGLTLAVVFLVAALWRLRPDNGRQLAWYAAVLGSAPVLLALDRGNNDLVIFILLAPVVPCLVNLPRLGWLGAVALITAAAMLKYYPAAAALVLLAGAKEREARTRLVLSLLVLLLAALSMKSDLATAGPRVPQPEGLMHFGAAGLFNALGWTGRTAKLLVLIAGLAFAAGCWVKRGLQNWEPAAAQRSDYLHFILGAVLLTGCFFLTLNYSYRWIFAIWLAPLLWVLPRDAAAPARVRRLMTVMKWLMAFVLWWATVCTLALNGLLRCWPEAPVQWLQRGCFLIEQPVDWAFFLCLLVFLVHFARRRLAELFARPISAHAS